MSSRRIRHSWGVALLLTFASAALAESSTEEAVSREESATEASLLTCEPARCGADWMCEDMCPSAETAVCVNFYCQYTYPSGGGGGGGGNPGSLCTGYRCGGDWNCVCEGQQGSCGPDFMCVF